MPTNQLPIRVYYEDTDAGGVVYYANYLRFAERARTEFIRSAGYESAAMAKNDGILLVVRHLEVDYKASARLDDALMVETTLIDLGKASFTMQQDIKRGDELLVSMQVVLACINLAGRPTRLPTSFRTFLEGNINK